ncbi:MAG: HAD family phosphatase [Myxococcales bacterium]|jgi:FMN phosphatase YigB (HAD superfamily)|nr:HAD family phosphatase [Myxococcales bacterium]
MPRDGRPSGLDSWDAVIFDLGGVLLNLDYSATTEAFQRLAGRELPGFYSKARQAELFDRFERGELDAAQFRDALRRALETECLDAELDAAWNALLGEVPGRNVELLLRLRETHRVYLLSNTNELHLADFAARFERDHGPVHGPWSALFHKDYYSHLIGLRKPDRAVFDHVVRAEGLDPRRTLFIDDNWHNVLGARDAGLHGAWLDVPARGTSSKGGPPPSELHPRLDGARDVHELFARFSGS